MCLNNFMNSIKKIYDLDSSVHVNYNVLSCVFRIIIECVCLITI